MSEFLDKLSLLETQLGRVQDRLDKIIEEKLKNVEESERRNRPPRMRSAIEVSWPNLNI